MQKLTQITRANIDAMDKVPRLKLINSLSGFKCANLVGTKSGDREPGNLQLRVPPWLQSAAAGVHPAA